MGLSIWLTALFGKFALYNPDATVYYGAKGGVKGLGLEITETLDTDSDILYEQGYTEVVPIHNYFVYWFTWGFLSSVFSNTLYSLRVYEKIPLAFHNSVGCLLVINTVAWLVAGAVWRFGKAGLYASGDIVPSDFAGTDAEWLVQLWNDEETIYQVHSGKFIKVYCVLCISMVAMCLCTVGLGCLVACCAIAGNLQNGNRARLVA